MKLVGHVSSISGSALRCVKCCSSRVSSAGLVDAPVRSACNGSRQSRCGNLIENYTTTLHSDSLTLNSTYVDVNSFFVYMYQQFCMRCRWRQRSMTHTWRPSGGSFRQCVANTSVVATQNTLWTVSKRDLICAVLGRRSVQSLLSPSVYVINLLNFR